MRGLDILFELEVVQGYFAQSEARRLRFSPNVQSADWICRTGVIVRTTPRGIRVYRESGRALGQGGNGPPAQLEFWVKSDDPLFGAYTAGLVPRLVQDLALARADGTYRSELQRFARFDVLVLDDFLIGSMKDAERRDLLEVLEDRYDRSSTVITSQLPTKVWHETLADPTIADAICDRLVHNAHLLALRGPSMRKKKGISSETT